MTNIAVIENKISSIKKYLKILKGFKKYSLNRIKNNLTVKGAVERYLYLAVQATIDLAEAVIAFRNLRKPSVYSEAFDILKEEKIIADKLAEKLIAMTGFRNVIAHDYEKIDLAITYDVLQKGLKDIEQFVKAIRKETRA